jgi:hypothetical protein
MCRALAAALFVPTTDTYRTACQLLFRIKRGEKQGGLRRSSRGRVVIVPHRNAG